MVIDIDAFLDKYNLEETKEEDQKIDLDFQKDVEKNLTNIKKKAMSKDILILKRIYEEVKGFDIDLPNKFLGIENKSNEALKELGQKYSEDFLKTVKNNAVILETQIFKILTQIKILIEKNEYHNISNKIKELHNLYLKFPKEILINKIKINHQIKKLEINIYEQLKKFKKQELSIYKNTIRDLIVELNASLKPLNISKIESKIEYLNFYTNNLPKIFLSDLIDEKIYISKILIKSEQYLEEQYKLEFETRKKIIYDLFDKFHKYQIQKNLDEVVLIYDEILYNFNLLPEVFLEEKIKVYNDINSLYVLINDLLLNNNLTLFLQSYQSSKTLQEIRDYLNHSKQTKQINIGNLELLLEKINSIPEKFHIEKEELRREIKMYLVATKKKLIQLKEKEESNINQKKVNLNLLEQEKINEKLKNDKLVLKKRLEERKHKLEIEEILELDKLKLNKKIEETKKQLIEINNLFDKLKYSENIKEIEKYYNQINLLLKDLILPSMQKQNLSNKIKTTKEQKIKNIINNQKIKNKSSKKEKIDSSNTNFNKDALIEINNLFLKLKESKNISEIKNYYKKITLNLNTIQISDIKKQEILGKIKEILLNKKLNK